MTYYVALFLQILEVKGFKMEELVNLLSDEGSSLYMRWKFVALSSVDKGKGSHWEGSLLKHKSIYGKELCKSVPS